MPTNMSRMFSKVILMILFNINELLKTIFLSYKLIYYYHYADLN